MRGELPDGEGVLTRPALVAYRTVGFILGLLLAGAVGGAVASSAFSKPADAKAALDLAAKIDKLDARLDDFNRRLSWMEGATSGTVTPLPVRGAGVGR